jgi:hypothetical protein
LILLSDANILIDLGQVSGLALLVKLAPIEVLSTVLLECEHESQPNLLEDIAVAGIRTIEVEENLLRTASDYADDRLSLMDRQCLIYARDEGRVLLTGDAALVTVARGHQVEAHGTLWVVSEGVKLGHLKAADACRWLESWLQARRWLPRQQVQQLRRQLGCQP